MKNIKPISLLFTLNLLVSCVAPANYIQTIEEHESVTTDKLAFVNSHITLNKNLSIQLGDELKEWNLINDFERLRTVKENTNSYFFEGLDSLNSKSCIGDSLIQLSELKFFNTAFLTDGGSTPILAPIIKESCNHGENTQAMIPLVNSALIRQVTTLTHNPILNTYRNFISYVPVAIVGYAIYDFKKSKYVKIISNDFTLGAPAQQNSITKLHYHLTKNLPLTQKVNDKLERDLVQKNTGANFQFNGLVEKKQSDGHGNVVEKNSGEMKSLSFDLRTRFFYERYGVEYSYGLGRNYISVPEENPLYTDIFNPHITVTRHMFGGLYAFLLPQQIYGVRGIVNAGISFENYTWNDDAKKLLNSPKIEDGIGFYVGTNFDLIVNYYIASFGVEYHRVEAASSINNVIISISPVGFKF